MISIRETLETFNNEQFESFIYFSIYFFFSHLFLLFLCYSPICPKCLSRRLPFLGLCPFSLLCLGCPHIRNHNALQGSQSRLHFSHAFQGLLHLVSPRYSFGFLLHDSHTSTHFQISTRMCYCRLRFPLLFCQDCFLRGMKWTIPED